MYGFTGVFEWLCSYSVVKQGRVMELSRCKHLYMTSGWEKDSRHLMVIETQENIYHTGRKGRERVDTELTQSQSVHWGSAHRLYSNALSCGKFQIPACACGQFFFSGQVEAFPTQTEKASEVVKTLLKEIIPQLRLPYSLQFSWAPKSLQMLTAAMKLKTLSLWGGKKMTNLDSILKKAMAPHSSTLAWKIPWMEEPGRLQSMGSLRVGHDWATSLSLFTFMHWRRKWQPTPVFLPGESQGRRGLVGCCLWGRTESDMTEAT